METVITPYSWREFLRAHGQEPEAGNRLVGSAERSRLEALFENYMEWGGFPEVLEMSTNRERVELLQGYVDIVLLRDIGERHGVGNLAALRAFVRHLLRHPAQLLSVSKTYRDFQSRGIGVAKGSLLEYLEYLEDAFLVFGLPLAVGSERRRQTNPRKLYVADHGLARAYAGRIPVHRGRMLENVVACSLKKRCRDLGYLLTNDGLDGPENTTGKPCSWDKCSLSNERRSGLCGKPAVRLMPGFHERPDVMRWSKVYSAWRWLLGS